MGWSTHHGRLVSNPNIPGTITDGDDNTQLSEQDVEGFVTNDAISLHEDTTLNGQQILTLGMDSDTLADISCSDGDIPKWNGITAQWYCALDSDTLADLNCAAGQILKYDNALGWQCSSDTDTNDWNSLGNIPSDFSDGVDNTLSESEVENFVTNERWIWRLDRWSMETSY